MPPPAPKRDRMSSREAYERLRADPERWERRKEGVRLARAARKAIDARAGQKAMAATERPRIPGPALGPGITLAMLMGRRA